MIGVSKQKLGVGRMFDDVYGVLNEAACTK